MKVINSDLKKIVDEWVDTNSNDILMGHTIKSPKELLHYERKILSLVMQLGVLIITWILITRLQDKNFQKYAKKKFITRLLRFERKISMLRDIYLISGDADGYSDHRISRLC
jgi:hypothetical protein